MFCFANEVMSIACVVQPADWPLRMVERNSVGRLIPPSTDIPTVLSVRVNPSMVGAASSTEMPTAEFLTRTLDRLLAAVFARRIPIPELTFCTTALFTVIVPPSTLMVAVDAAAFGLPKAVEPLYMSNVPPEPTVRPPAMSRIEPASMASVPPLLRSIDQPYALDWALM